MTLSAAAAESASASFRAVEADGSSVMNQEIFTEFYERYARRLWAYLRRSSGSSDVADDLVQETFYRFMRVGFEPESETHGRRYLYKIATNLLRDHFRSPRRAERSIDEETVEVESSGPRPLLRRDVRLILRQLRPRDRQLLWLAHAEQFSHREIAAVLGLKEQSVRLMVFRARKRMAAELERRNIGPEVMR